MTRPPLGTWSLLARAVALGAAAFAATWGIALPSGVIAAVVGAAAGVIVGQLLGRSSLRLWSALAGIAAGVIAAHALARFSIDSAFVPAHLGTRSTLRLASVLRYGSAMLGGAAALRTIASRRPIAVGLELAAVGAALSLVFAGHRDGVIARPLWLGDWAWQQGIDPVMPLLVIGGGAAAVLAVILLATGRSRRAPAAFVFVAALIALAIWLLRNIGLPEATPVSLGFDGGADAGGQGSADAGNSDGGGSAKDGGGSDSEDGGASDGGSSDEPPDLSKPQSTKGEDSPMAVVILDDDYNPPSQTLYFRQDAWSDLNGSRLLRATRSDADTDVPESFPSRDAPVFGAPHKEGRAEVHTLIALLIDHPRPFALDAPSLLSPAKNPDPKRFKRAYRVTSLSQSETYQSFFGKRVGDPAWPADLRAHYLKVPDDPRYAELARSIVSTLPERRRDDPFAMAAAVKLKLDDAFSYSTQHKHAGASDPTADFLFGDRIGYCVHFSHAAVYLWRALGIPARVGVGYAVDDDRRRGGSAILIRGRDAHAWPELYIEGYGWLILDIAPKTNLDPPASPMDSELQRMMGEMARNLPPDPTDTKSERELPPHFGRDVGRAVLLLLALALLVLYSAKIWRRLAPRFAGAPALPWIGYRGALDMLSEVGASRRYGESREAFAERVRALAPTFGSLTSLHLRAALGGGASDGDVQAWREGLSAVRREIAAAMPLRRRVIGAVNPASFLGSR